MKPNELTVLPAVSASRKSGPVYVYYGRLDEDNIPLFVELTAGTGDALGEKDIQYGFVDYINLNICRICEEDPLDGGILLLREPVSEHPNGVFDLIPQALEELGIRSEHVFVI